jgi:hypothetical protein
MTTQQQPNGLNRRQVLALRGLRLPSAALKKLREAGIYCEPAISIEYQHLAKRYVIWGRESGGAVAQIGAYCGFADVTGERLEWLTRIDAVGRNGIHATVVAPGLVRIQVFRVAQTFELLITRHDLAPKVEGSRPSLQNRVLFHGVNGTVPSQLSVGQGRVHGQILPGFRTRGGEVLPVPAAFQEVARIAVAGTFCFGCHSPHLLLPRTDETAEMSSSEVGQSDEQANAR